MTRLALLATAVTLTLGATPAFATFSDYNGKDTVATTEQGNTAAVGTVGNYYGPMNGGIPIIGSLFGMAGNGWQSNQTCGLYHDFNGRYTALCGL